jgi:hypothetical protein
MNSHSLSPVEGDPRAYIDRTREREKFLAMFPPAPPAPHRVMQIFAPSGSGKSGLLRLFRDYCGNEVDARSVLIDLRIDDDQAPLTVLDIATAIRDAIAFDREFGEFERLTEAMEIEDHAVFFAEAATRSTVVNANVYIKQVQNSPITAMNVHTGAGRDGPFTSAQKDVATRRCVEAFGSELRALVATTPVLIAIDHWERGPRELLDWIQRDLVRAEMAASESSRLRLVVAGQPRSAEWPLGLEDQQFRREFASLAAFDAAVSRHPKLSAFKEEELTAFLELYGLERTNPRFDDALSMMRTLAEGAEYNPQVLINILKFAQNLKPVEDPE